MSSQPSPAVPSDSATPDRVGAHVAVQWLLGVLLVFAPLFSSGRPPLAVLTLELLAIAMLVLVLWQRKWNLVTRPEAVALALLFLFPLLYLVPLPAGFAALLPGREAYLAAQELMGATPGTLLSLYPGETEAAWLLMLVPIAIFLATRTLSAEQAYRLVLVLLTVAALQALLGLMQFGAGKASPQLFGMSIADVRSGQGTYTNNNHLAGLLEMVLPIAIALTVFHAGGRAKEPLEWRRRIAFFASLRGRAAFLFGAVALLVLLGLIFTRSRGGIALGMLGILLSTALFARRIGGDNIYGPTGTIVASAMGMALAIGLVPVLDRFSVEGAIEDARWTIFSSTLDGIGTFNPIGSGPGNYPDVYPAFQPFELGQWFINHAHNDYLEWVFEGGVLAAALILLLLVLFARQWARMFAREAWTRFRFVQVGAGIGILLLLLHSLVDYNLHTPANIAYFAFLAGLFFSEVGAGDVQHVRRRRRRRTPLLEEVTEEAAAPDDESTAPPPDQIRNPFLD